MNIKNRFLKLQTSTGIMKYLSNTSWLLAERILRMGVGLFVGIWIARYLGPENFGLFSYAQSYVLLFTAIASLGLDGIVVRELVKNEDYTAKLLGTAFVLKFIGALLVNLLLYISMYYNISEKSANVLIFIIGSATIFQSFNVIDFYFQSKVLSKYVVFSNAICLFISSITKVVLIVNDGTLTQFALVFIFDGIVLVIGLMFFYSKKEKTIVKWTFDKKLAITLLRDSWPLIFSAMVVSIYMKIDQVMIQSQLGNAAVGQYAAAVRLSEAWYFIPTIIASSLFPSIIKIKQKCQTTYLKRFQNLNDLMVWGAISISIPVTFLADFIIIRLYGEQYQEATDVLILHIWASVFVFMSVASGKFLVVENMNRKVFYRNSCGLVINICLNIVLIPAYGINGAAVATLISWFVAGYLYDLFDKDVNYIFRIKSNSFNPMRLFRLGISK